MKYHVLDYYDMQTHLLELHILGVGVTQATAAQDPDAMVLDYISLAKDLSHDAQPRVEIVRHATLISRTRYGCKGTLPEDDPDYVAYGADERAVLISLLTTLHRLLMEAAE